MGVRASSGQPPRPHVNRPFGPGEFAVAWLTFKGDSVENADHRYVAKKDGLVTSKLLLRLYGNATMQCLADEDGEFISREMFVATLALCYEGNTEDRISYIFTMYSIIYGLEREGEGCLMKKDYLYLLGYLESFNFIPKKLYEVFEECRIPANGRLLNSQFVQWVRKYPLLMEFLASHLPPVTSGGSGGPLSPAMAALRTSEDFTGRGDPLNNSPSCRDQNLRGNTSGGHGSTSGNDTSSAMFGSFDFIGGEDSGDDSDEGYDSDEMDEFGDFQSADMSRHDGFDEGQGGGDGDRSDRSDCEESSTNSTAGASSSSTGQPTSNSDPLSAATGTSSGSRRSRSSRSRGGVHKMGRNITKTLGGGISKVGRTILHGKASDPATAGAHSLPPLQHLNGHVVGDATSASLLAAGYAFSSESQISKHYVCGYLHKVSDSKWAKRSWHRRWFVLDRQQGILSYYRHNPANNLITSTPRGNIIHMEDDDDSGDGGSGPTTTSQHPPSTTGAREPPSTSSTAATVKEDSPITSPRSYASHQQQQQHHHHQMLYLNKSHPWYRGELNLNVENVSLLFEKSLARNAPSKFFFQVSTLSLQEMIDSKRHGVQYKLCAEREDDFDQWTLAIASAINKKHDSERIKSEPTLSHQQLYRQRLLHEQQEAAAAAAAQAKQAEAEAEKAAAIAASTAKALPAAAVPGASPSKPVPPRIITHHGSSLVQPMHSHQHAQQDSWRLQINVEGSKPCLIVGFIVNIIALKCVAPEHAVWKVLVCIGVTCAYVATIYNPPRRIHGAFPAAHGMAGGAAVDHDASLVSGTEAVMCADPQNCCIHRAAAHGTSTSTPIGADLNGVVPMAPALVLPPVGGFKKFPLGSSMAKTEMNVSGKSSLVHQAWACTRAETFQIRSLEYKKTKRKEPSKAALFEFLGADLLRTDGKVDLISQRVELPEMYANDKVFIINAQLPAYGPSVWGGDTTYDGPGFSLVLCWKIPQQVCDELNGAADGDQPQLSKELRLFKRFQRAGNDATLTDRFKVIAQVTNQDDCGLTGMAKKLLASHNATPVLTRPQHRLYHFNEGSTEIVVDIHAFSYIARRGIHMLLDKCAKLVIDIAFVLQGETDDELPERILGCCRLDCVDVAKAMELPR